MKNNLLASRLRILRAIRHTAGDALPDDIYRGILQRVAGVDSSTKLRRLAAVDDVIDELHRLGFGQRPNHYARTTKREWYFVDSAAPERQPLLRKIIMQVKSAGISPGKQVAYAEGIARQMGGFNATPGNGPVEKPLQMCSAEELWRIVAALGVHLRRQGTTSGAEKR